MTSLLGPNVVRDHSFPIIGSLALHALLALAVVLCARLSFDSAVHDSPGPSIEAVAVDSRVLQAVQDHKQAQALAEQQRRAEAEQAQQQAQDEARQKEQQAAQARAADQANAAQAQAAAQAKALAQAKAAQQEQALEAANAAKTAARQASARQAAAAAAKAAVQQRTHDEQQQSAAAAAAKQKVAEDKAHAERENELRRQLADEEHVSAVENSPLRDRYIASIQNRITRAWLKPESAHAGIVCHIDVTQIPGGEVTKVAVTDCNGDEAVRQSIENAVYRASPLPEPPDPALFQRNLTLVFKPND